MSKNRLRITQRMQQRILFYTERERLLSKSTPLLPWSVTSVEKLVETILPSLRPPAGSNISPSKWNVFKEEVYDSCVIESEVKYKEDTLHKEITSSGHPTLWEWMKHNYRHKQAMLYQFSALKAPPLTYTVYTPCST